MVGVGVTCGLSHAGMDFKTRRVPTAGFQWVHTWITEIVFIKNVCVCVPIYRARNYGQTSAIFQPFLAIVSTLLEKICTVLLSMSNQIQ